MDKTEQWKREMRRQRSMTGMDEYSEWINTCEPTN